MIVILINPKKATTYEGISLGASMDEVKYILGFPSYVLHPIEDLSKGKGKPMMAQMQATDKEIQNSSNGVDDFFDWQYDKDIKRIDIGFDVATRRVKSIGLLC